MEVLSWDDIEPAARDAFTIWTSGSDLVWAQRAWELLMKAGLCRYQTERERHIVIGQFLALASIYRDWCSVARDETQEDTPGYWIDGIDVHPLYLGQIVGDEELSDDPEEALWDALRQLMHAHRSAVIEALRKELGEGDEGLVRVLLAERE